MFERTDGLILAKRVVLIAAVLVAAGLLDGCDGGDAQVTAQLEADARARKAVSPIDFLCIAQYGPSERWISPATPPVCASAARVVPNHVISMPVTR